jgi:hypothetical protein
MKKALTISVIALCIAFVAQISFAQSTCEKYGIISVANGEYKLANNEWGSDAAQCIQSNGSTGFTVTSCAINKGSVGSFPSLWKGCHWGDCTTNSGCPIQVSQIGSASVSYSVSSTRPSGNYDVMGEAWLSPNSDSTNGYASGCELMIVLDYHGMGPAGGQIGTFNGYTVYETNIGWNFITYVKTGTSSVSVNLKDFINDAMSRGYIQSSWYLHDFEAGFEIMSGGVGLAANSFSFSVSGGSNVTNPPPVVTPAPTSGPTATPAPGVTVAPTSVPTATPAPATTAAPTNPPSTGTCTCKAGCTSTTSIGAPFTKDGTGEFCFTAGSLGSYVNSWNLDALEINGKSITNAYTATSSLPAPIGGLYYVYYKSSVAWGHFEAK